MDEFIAAVLQTQVDACYPQLFAGPWADRGGVLDYRLREASSLVAIAARHDALTPDQMSAIGEFRLHQYVLYGLYDVAKVQAHHLTTDPSLETLAGETIHVLVGTAEGRVLAYMSLEPAHQRDAPLKQPDSAQPAPPPRGTHHLNEPDRPLFPCEVELFGPGVFSSLPALHAIPLSQMRELTRLQRNYVARSPLGVAASAQAILTTASVLLRDDLSFKVSLGCIDREGRWLAAHLGMPMIFAPLANVSVTPSDDPRTAYWSAPANAQGRFWPFASLTQDLRRRAAHLIAIDEALSLPGTEMRRALVELRRAAPPFPDLEILPASGDSPVVWTSDPGFRGANGDPDGAYARRPTVSVRAGTT